MTERYLHIGRETFIKMYMRKRSEQSGSIGKPAAGGPAGAPGRVFLPAVIIMIFAAGCGDRDLPAESAKVYRSVVGESLKLYTELHPLRSSRLGIPGCDSLLFTFSAREVEYCCGRCDSLLARISALPEAHFGEKEIEDSALIIDWLRGELFAMRKVRAWKTNPLLYCSMIEEALFAVPSRVKAPAAGELRAYEIRLGRLPRLLRNAELNLENPAEIHLGLSLKRIDSIFEKTSGLRETLVRRYGSIPPSFDEAMAGIGRFGDFLRAEQGSATHGSYILGTENISDILLFSEHLDLDLDEFTAEAGQSIRKNMSQAASIDRNPAFGAKYTGAAEIPGVQAVLDSIGRMAFSGHITASGKETIVPVVRMQMSAVQRVLCPNPYLSVPAHEPAATLSISATPFDDGPCGTVIVVPPGEEEIDPEGFVYRMMKICACVSEPYRTLCARDDTLRTVFASELFAYGWEYLLMKDLCQLYPDPPMRLRKKLLEDASRDLAMTATVFGLHSGRFTIDSAVDYLTATLGIDRETAFEKVSIAAASPSAAYPGIAIILIEQMIKDASEARGERQPRARIRELMLEKAALPLPMVRRGMGK